MKEPVGTKYLSIDQILGQINYINNSAVNIVGFDREWGADSKLYKHLKICAVVNRMRTDAKIKFYKTIAVHVLLYGSGTAVK